MLKLSYSGYKFLVLDNRSIILLYFIGHLMHLIVVLETSIQSDSNFSAVVYVGISTSIANIDRNSIIPTSSDKAAIHLCYIVHNSFQQYILKPTSGTNTSTIF